MKKYTTLYIMVGVAVAALLLGFLVIRQRINTPSSQSQQSSKPSNQGQQATAQPTTPVQTTPPVAAPDTSTAGWQTYNNTKYGFSLLYPANLKVGTVSGNSGLGTFTAPIKGFHVGPLVLVVLKTADLKKQGGDYFNGFYQDALHPQTPVGAKGGPATVCKIDAINNASAPVKSVSCAGEGGAAQYAYIAGTAYDVFVDGYTKGYDKGDFGSLSKGTDYVNILTSFKFSTASANQPVPPVVKQVAPPPTPAPAPKPDPNPTIKNFTITADDTSATPAEISVPKGTIVEVTFKVAATNVSSGGLDFRSSALKSGTIQAGGSKTISFTANQSFVFTPYGPANNLIKPYTIKVTVQ